jgi:hypothetical protein
MTEAGSSSPAIRRSRMPVRVTIHSSVVSTMRSKSALRRILAGRYAPVPVSATTRPDCI